MRSNKVVSLRVTLPAVEVVKNLFRKVAVDFGLGHDPSVLRACSLLGAGKYAAFLDLTSSWSEQQYAQPGLHLAWNQLACLLKKYPFVDTRLSPESAALKKFWAAEYRCRRVNQRFTARRNAVSRGRIPTHEAALDRASEWIRSVIGDEPMIGQILDMSGFGPGASVGVSGSLTHAGVKLSAEKWTVSPTCVEYARSALKRNPLVWEYLLDTPLSELTRDHLMSFDEAFKVRTEHVLHNKIVCVPKTAKVHRTIAIEPLLNGYVQKGIDLYLRKKLRRVGLDLTDQTANQHLAMRGSMEEVNPFATLDLSSASDSISREIVRRLLPPAWFYFLNNTRSTHFVLDGVQHEYEKFASMGNGFCFPLETLIFASLVHSAYAVTGDKDFLVYGDDIIVRQSSALLLTEYLKLCGFSLNRDKSFFFGPFRESCGADWYLGKPVRPYYVDEIPKNWGDIFKWMNGLRRITGECHAWEYLNSVLPLEWRFYRPHDGDDTAITTDLDKFMSSGHSKWCRHLQTWRWKTLRPRPFSDSSGYHPAVLMYGALSGVKSRQGRVWFVHRRKTVAEVRWATT